MMSNEMSILSAGIDIGTTTTQLIISRLKLKNRMPGSRIPKIEITDKEVIYRSPVHFTPINHHKSIDADRLRALLDNEYLQAGIDRHELDTGAVIITGETAKKENAEKIVHLMADYAGDFVVAVAGPDVESVLAGKGSGAMALSHELRRRIINLDVGGGTTNMAIFNNGKLEASTCINVGGRLIETDVQTGEALYVAKPLAEMLERLDLGGLGATGSFRNTYLKPPYDQICEWMTQAVDACALHEPLPMAQTHLMMGDSLPLRLKTKQEEKGRALYDGVVFSGGVAEYIYQHDAGSAPYPYGDIGLQLAKALRQGRLATQYPLIEPKEKIRATVIGAGSYAMEVSGSTIHINWHQLPVRNVPVARLEFQGQLPEQDLLESMIWQALNRYGLALQTNARGLAIDFGGYPSYANLEKFARALVQGWKRLDNGMSPLILLTEQDVGKALGQALNLLTGENGNFASIDAVSVKDGDYVDIGKPVLDGSVVPVIVKTLIFQSGGISN